MNNGLRLATYDPANGGYWLDERAIQMCRTPYELANLVARFAASCQGEKKLSGSLLGPYDPYAQLAAMYATPVICSTETSDQRRERCRAESISRRIKCRKMHKDRAWFEFWVYTLLIAAWFLFCVGLNWVATKTIF